MLDMKIIFTHYSYITQVILKAKNELLPDKNQTYKQQFVQLKLEKHIILMCHTEQKVQSMYNTTESLPNV